jgi:CDP-paratose 2-epimerase
MPSETKSTKPSILITGGLGFIGSRLTQRLQQRFQITILDWDKRSPVAVALAKGFRRSGIAVHHRDVAMAASWKDLPACDFVFHAAGQVAAVDSDKKPVRDHRTNVQGAFHVAEYARRCQARVLFCNTVRVYDYAAVDRLMAARGEIDEDCSTIDSATVVQPHIAVSKRLAELQLLCSAQMHGLRVISHRMSGIVGPRQPSTPTHGWLSELVSSAMDRKPFTIYGDGEQTRDVLHIDDLLDLFGLELADFDRFCPEPATIYNIGGGPSNELSIHGVIRVLQTEFGAEIKPNYGPARPAEPKRYVTALSKIRGKGWKPAWTDPVRLIENLVAAHGKRSGPGGNPAARAQGR